MELTDTDIDWYKNRDGIAVDRAGNLRGVYLADGSLHLIVRDDAFYERARDLWLRACSTAISTLARHRRPLIVTRIDLRRVTTWRQVLSRVEEMYWAYKGPYYRYSKPIGDVEVCIVLHADETEGEVKSHPKRRTRRSRVKTAQGFLLARFGDGSDFRLRSPVFARRHSKNAVLTWFIRRLRTTHSFLAEVVMVAAVMHRTAV